MPKNKNTIKSALENSKIGDSFFKVVNPDHPRKYMQTMKALKSYIRTLSYNSDIYTKITPTNLFGKEAVKCEVIGMKTKDGIIGRKIGSGRKTSKNINDLAKKINKMSVGDEFVIKSDKHSNLINRKDPKRMRQRVYTLNNRGLINVGLSVSVVENGINVKVISKKKA